MEHDDNLRIDKWLWAVRIFKTRSQAAEACKKGRIIIDEIQVKPSRTIKVGEVVFVKRPPVTYQFKVLGLLHNRKSAKIAADFVKDITPDEEKLKLEMKNYTGFEIRQKGYGRPTKRERRLIDRLKKKY
ncbi:MAG: RNA-binding S4 domain-containing protein [Thiohalospira sp.]